MRAGEPHHCKPNRRKPGVLIEGEGPVIYHHAITAAAAKERVKELIKQASADRLAESATTPRRRLRWRAARVASRNAQGITSPTTEATS
jgi:hypothetical protein